MHHGHHADRGSSPSLVTLEEMGAPAALVSFEGVIEAVNPLWEAAVDGCRRLGGVGARLRDGMMRLGASARSEQELAAVLGGVQGAAAIGVLEERGGLRLGAMHLSRGGILLWEIAAGGAGVDSAGEKVAARDGGVAEGQAHLSTIVDHAMDAILTVDERQRVVMFNRTAERVFGVSQKDAIGSSLERFIPERFRREHAGHVQSFGRTGVTTRVMGRLGTLYGLRADGKEFPIEASISQAIAGGRRLYTVILRDISERRLLEEQLIQSQKMEGIGRLAGGVAHDFNNLLTVMFGYLAVASSMLETTHRAQPALTHTREAADRAAKLTRQLLAFARKQIVTPRIFAVREAVGSLAPMLRRLIGEDVMLDVALDADTGYVRADVGQFEQVIMNLTVNARDAMPSGGRLSIRTANVFLDETYCRTHVGAAVGPYVEVAVSDTGVGMSDEVKARLFEPFFTTKGPGKGTGLGLATCHGVVKQGGGHIAVESEVGKGTKVRVFLPREPEDSLLQLELKPEAPSRGGTETILLVEDNSMVRELVGGALSNAGYRVLAAENGTRAIRIAAETEGVIHLLVTDVVMPEMSGVRLAEAIGQTRAGVKVLYMSGYTEETIVRHGVESEEMAFLPKPFTVDAMLTKVRQVLDAGVRVVR